MADYLLEEVRKLVDKNELNCNPSLYLDKFTGYLSQEDAKDALKKITKLTKNSYLITKNRLELLQNLPNFTSKKFKTQGPFTIHLSRDIALENTGICFHPIYGFVYIPGSGIKGLARAYAEQVWKPAQSNKDDAEKTIIEIFGNENTEKDPTKMKAGKVVFHDAFPEIVPQLYVSISNCHHPGYYSEDKKIMEQLKPGETGDFENPKPVYFLAVKEGAVFNFGLSIRQGLNIIEEYAKNLINQAFEFLAGGLAHMGLGAKTSSGFGTFIEVPENNNKPINVFLPNNQNKFVTFEGTLKFTTPAFLAGALQEKEDCTLTSQTLRGQLRWWWRVIHSNFLESYDLLKLEKLVWGLTDTSSPIRIEVEKPEKQKLGDITDLIKRKDRNGRVIRNERGRDIEISEYKYITFGMYKMGNEGKDRYFINPETEYNFSIYCQDVKNDKGEVLIKKEEVLKQAQFALYLLTTYGGLGAKSRKGFGSVVLTEKMENINEETIKKESEDLRIKLTEKKLIKINNNKNWNLITKQIDYKTDFPLQNLAKTYFAFMSEYKNNPTKKCAGLPRYIQGPKILYQKNPQKFKKPIDLHLDNIKIDQKEERHSSPIIFHIDKKNKKINIAIIPTNYLINRDTCQKFLEKFAEKVKNNIDNPPLQSNYKKSNNPNNRNNYGRGNR
jgi:CRISPR-associated protein Cmr6